MTPRLNPKPQANGYTGRRRYRESKRWFRSSVLVLQVEVIQEYLYNDDRPGKRSLWRDARIEDLLTTEPFTG